MGGFLLAEAQLELPCDFRRHEIGARDLDDAFAAGDADVHHGLQRVHALERTDGAGLLAAVGAAEDPDGCPEACQLEAPAARRSRSAKPISGQSWRTASSYAY